MVLGLSSPCRRRRTAAAPAPCGGVAQIADAAGDGHHGATDVVAAWWSEAAGRLQAVIQIRVGAWAPEHDDAEVNGSGYALVFTSGGQTRYVRVGAPPAGQGAVSYDYGTYTAPGGFASAGQHDRRAGLRRQRHRHDRRAGGVRARRPARCWPNPFVLTYDGVTGGVPDWVDHAPGGVLPGDASFGADYVRRVVRAGAAAG